MAGRSFVVKRSTELFDVPRQGSIKDKHNIDRGNQGGSHEDFDAKSFPGFDKQGFVQMVDIVDGSYTVTGFKLSSGGRYVRHILHLSTAGRYQRDGQLVKRNVPKSDSGVSAPVKTFIINLSNNRSGRYLVFHVQRHPGTFKLPTLKSMVEAYDSVSGEDPKLDLDESADKSDENEDEGDDCEDEKDLKEEVSWSQAWDAYKKKE